MLEQSSVRELIEAVAGPRQWSDTRQSWLSRAARRSGLTYRTIRGIFYGEITNASHPAIRLLKHTAEKNDTSPKALAHRFEAIARGMESTDSDFYRAEISSLLDAISALRNLVCAGDDPED